MCTEYRIIEETLENNTKRYVVEKRTVVFKKYVITDWETDTYDEDRGYYCIANIPAVFNELSEAQSYIDNHYNKGKGKELRVIDRKVIIDTIEK